MFARMQLTLLGGPSQIFEFAISWGAHWPILFPWGAQIRHVQCKRCYSFAQRCLNECSQITHDYPRWLLYPLGRIKVAQVSEACLFE